MNTSHVDNLAKSHRSTSLITASLSHIPVWKRIPHKGMQTLPEEELYSQIEEVGKQLAHAKNDREYSQIYSQTDELRAQFMSSASPDRKGMMEEGDSIIGDFIKNATNALNGGKKKDISQMGFLELVFLYKEKGLGVNAEGDPQWMLKGGGTMEPINLSTGGVGFIFKENGKQVLSNTIGDWTYSPTEAELVRMNMFHKVLYNATDTEKQNIINNTPQIGSSKGSLDISV